jgi:hypothetical protein
LRGGAAWHCWHTLSKTRFGSHGMSRGLVCDDVTGGPSLLARQPPSWTHIQTAAPAAPSMATRARNGAREDTGMIVTIVLFLTEWLAGVRSRSESKRSSELSSFLRCRCRRRGRRRRRGRSDARGGGLRGHAGGRRRLRSGRGDDGGSLRCRTRGRACLPWFCRLRTPTPHRRCLNGTGRRRRRGFDPRR